MLTDTRQAECASRTPAKARQLTIMDRGYARVRSFQAVLREGGDFIARTGWRQLVFHDARGRRIDLMVLLRGGARRIRQRRVWVRGVERPLRLVIQPLPPEIAARQRAKRARKANKKSQTLDPRTAEAAGFLILLTSLPRQRLFRETGRRALSRPLAGRNRLQTHETLGGIDELPAADPVLARTWLLAHLIGVVLIEDLVTEILSFPP